MAARQLAARRFAITGTPVLMYHDVSASSPRDRWAVTLSNFSEQLAALREAGFSSTDFDCMAEGSSDRCVVLTFDDGIASHYDHVFPALVEGDYRATFFVSTALVGNPGYLTCSQIREMSDAGMQFGSHGHFHTDYSCLEPSIALHQLRGSRCSLEDVISKPITSFSAPYGFLSNALLECARSAGFEHVYSSRPWLATTRNAVIPRIAIYSDTSIPELLAIVEGELAPILSRLARHALLYAPKQLLLRAWPHGLGVNVQETAR
ncbi:MAG TPA: polysaccharide deacetylase family protein [Terriglobales bacterium]